MPRTPCRYLLASRHYWPLPAPDDPTPPALMDDHAISVAASQELAAKPFHRRAPCPACTQHARHAQPLRHAAAWAGRVDVPSPQGAVRPAGLAASLCTLPQQRETLHPDPNLHLLERAARRGVELLRLMGLWICVNAPRAAVMRITSWTLQCNPDRCAGCRLGAAFHLRLLSALCNDLIEGSVLKTEIQGRVDAMLALHTQHRQYIMAVRAVPCAPCRAAPRRHDSWVVRTEGLGAAVESPSVHARA